MKIFIALFILVFLTSCSDAVYDERGNLLCSSEPPLAKELKAS